MEDSDGGVDFYTSEFFQALKSEHASIYRNALSKCGEGTTILVPYFLDVFENDCEVSPNDSNKTSTARGSSEVPPSEDEFRLDASPPGANFPEEDLCAASPDDKKGFRTTSANFNSFVRSGEKAFERACQRINNWEQNRNQIG